MSFATGRLTTLSVVRESLDLEHDNEFGMQENTLTGNVQSNVVASDSCTCDSQAHHNLKNDPF